MNRLMIVVVAWVVLCQSAIAYITYDTWQMDKLFFKETLEEDDPYSKLPPVEIEV